eukprot:227603_1
MKSQLLAAVEGGGTSFVVTIALLRPEAEAKDPYPSPSQLIPHTSFEIIHQQSIPTTTPNETLAKCVHFFQQHAPEQGYDALGLACFGPLGVNVNVNVNHPNNNNNNNKDRRAENKTAE